MDPKDRNQINRQFWDQRISRENQSRVDRIKAICRETGVKYDPSKATFIPGDQASRHVRSD